MKTLRSSLVNLPVSGYLGYFWNLGSYLGVLIVFQIFSGFFLVFFYSNDILSSFDSVQYICREVNNGWIIRSIHFNGASIIFICLYLHIFKALFFYSYRLYNVWVSGFILFFILMIISFTGYVLVWSQISYWAAVVITSLLSTFPFYGNTLTLWVWGGFSVGAPTLNFFFFFHFLFPFLLLIFMIFHLFFLHEFGSTSSLGYSGSILKINFFSSYWVKDLLNFVPISLIFLFVLCFPYLLGDPEIFLEADSMLSPVHIVPEWYFLVYYAILRSVPNNTWGVVFMILSIICPFILFISSTYFSIYSSLFRALVFFFIFNSISLSWVGQCPLEPPFLILGLLLTFFYFIIVFFLFLFNFLTNVFINS